MKRREFITLIGGVAASPFAARAQQPERMRRIGVLQALAADDPEGQRRIAVFLQALQQAGWTNGRNVGIELRWAPGGSSDLLRKHAAELVALTPDVILCGGSGPLGALLAATRNIPIVFTIVVDPVGAGFVDSLARPGGNLTGFSQFEYGCAWNSSRSVCATAARSSALLPRSRGLQPMG
jgi:putative tryptophan/tyrosine transport system substrate-binding protein